jgi:hypothetical protein
MFGRYGLPESASPSQPIICSYLLVRRSFLGKESVMMTFARLLLVLALCSRLQAEFRSALAVRTVTPDPLLPVSGGIGPSNPATRKSGELTVRALVLDDGETRVAFVGADFLGFPAVLGDKVRARAPSIPAHNILIGATHTHSAPDCYGFPDGQGGFSSDLKYLEMVCARMAEAINEASARLQPSRLKIATGEAKGKIAYNYYAPQLYDPRCHVLQTVSPDGRPIATLVNYAIHPEVLGPKQGIVSPDLCGPLYERIANKGGGGALFMNSAQGGMVTADVRGPDGKDVQTWEECVRIGELLADEALRIVASAPAQEAPRIVCTHRLVRFKIDSPVMLQILKLSPLGYRAEADGSVVTTLNLVNIGNAQILTIPGEALPNIGYYLKRQMKGQHNFLFGLTNDAFGYIMTKEDFNSFKRYEYISRTSLGEWTGETLVNESLALIHSAPSPEPPR